MKFTQTNGITLVCDCEPPVLLTMDGSKVTFAGDGLNILTVGEEARYLSIGFCKSPGALETLKSWL